MYSAVRQYHGGTNFGHSSGGPFIATSYDYDAPIDEYGKLVILYFLLVLLSHTLFRKVLRLSWFYFLRKSIAGFIRQPKWGHLRDLHKAIKLCEAALVATDPTGSSLGPNLEVTNAVFYCPFLHNLNEISYFATMAVQFVPLMCYYSYLWLLQIYTMQMLYSEGLKMKYFIFCTI